MKFRWISISIVLTLLTAIQIVPSRADVAKDFTVPAQYILTKCKTATELDCIESVGLVLPDNVYNEGSLVIESVNPTSRIQNGNAIYSGSTIWKIGNEIVTLVGTLDSPVTKGCFSTCAALRFNVAVNNPLQAKVRFAFRTSWLRPMNVQMKAIEADYTYKKIPGGASWTMEGKGTTFSTYWAFTNDELNLKKNANAKADFDGTLFDFYIHHAGNTLQESYWDPKCSDKGFSVQSHNTNETGDPIWDSVNETLFFSIFAPHFKMNGDLNTGYFKYWTSHEFMDCKYPNNTLTKSPKLIIEILNEDGTQNVATTAVTNKDGILYFYASGFHFSSPRILIKAEKNSSAVNPLPSPTTSASPSPSPSATPIPTASGIIAPIVQPSKKITITCIKGKITKKVTAVNPKCPAGYKRVSASTSDSILTHGAPIGMFAIWNAILPESITAAIVNWEAPYAIKGITGYNVEISDNGTDGWKLFANVPATKFKQQIPKGAYNLTFVRVLTVYSDGVVVPGKIAGLSWPTP